VRFSWQVSRVIRTMSCRQLTQKWFEISRLRSSVISRQCHHCCRVLKPVAHLVSLLWLKDSSDLQLVLLPNAQPIVDWCCKLYSWLELSVACGRQCWSTLLNGDFAATHTNTVSSAASSDKMTVQCTQSRHTEPQNDRKHLSLMQAANKLNCFVTCPQSSVY